MRLLALILLLINLVVFMWFINTHEGKATDSFSVVVPDGVDRLQLFSETEQGKLVLGENECSSVGPFVVAAYATRAKTLLQRHDISSVINERSLQLENGYWIYLSGYKKKEEAEQIVRSMQAKGIDDVSIIFRGKKGFVVSLGIYSKLLSADERVSELKSVGFNVRKEPRYRSKKEFWLDLVVSPKVLKKILKEELDKRFSGIKAEYFNC